EIFEVLVPPFAKEPRIGQAHYARTHRNKIMPKGAAAAMWPDDEYGRLHKTPQTTFTGYLKAYQRDLKANSQPIIASGIKPRTPLCSPRRKAIPPFKVKGTKYSGTAIFLKPTLSWN